MKNREPIPNTDHQIPDTGDSTAIVCWAAAAFHANAGMSDDELVTILQRAGLPRAAHAVAMLPLAYGRRLLDGVVALPATFCEVDDAGEVVRETPLAHD